MKKVILLLMIAVYLASFTMSYAISDDSMDTLMKSIDDKLVVVSNSRSNTMFHVMVTDKNGKQERYDSKQYIHIYIYDFIIEDDGYVLVGQKFERGINGVVIKIDFAGVELYEKKIDGPSVSAIRKICKCGKDYFLVGITNDFSGFFHNTEAAHRIDVFIAKTDREFSEFDNDDLVDYNILQGSDNEEVVSGVCINDNLYVVTETKSKDMTYKEAFGYKNDKIISFITIFNNKLEIQKHSFILDGDVIIKDILYYQNQEKILVVGKTVNDAIFIQTDLFFNVESHHLYGGSATDEFTKILITGDFVYVGGNTRSDDGDLYKNEGENDIFLVKITTNGDIVDLFSAGSSKNDILYGMVSFNKEIVLIGQVQDKNTFFANVMYKYIIKIDEKNTSEPSIILIK